MLRFIKSPKGITVLAAATILAASSAWAGSPHFVGATILECDATSLTVTGKEAGLGNETQVHIELSALAECVNPGGHKPSADNKDEFSVSGDFPVQNGKANFSLTLEPSFQPDCTPPMTVVITDIIIEDSAHGLSRNLGDCP